MGYVLTGPQLLHRLQNFVGASSPGAGRNFQGFKFNPRVPLAAHANAEIQAAAGDLVHCRHQLRQHHRVVQRCDDYPGQDPDPQCGPGRRCHRRQPQHRGTWRVAVHDVLADGNPVKTQIFRSSGEFPHIPIIVHAQVAAERNGIVCYGHVSFNFNGHALCYWLSISSVISASFASFSGPCHCR